MDLNGGTSTYDVYGRAPSKYYLKVGLGGGADHIDNIAPPKKRAIAMLPFLMNNPDRNEVCWRVFLDIRIAL